MLLNVCYMFMFIKFRCITSYTYPRSPKTLFPKLLGNPDFRAGCGWWGEPAHRWPQPASTGRPTRTSCSWDQPSCKPTNCKKNKSGFNIKLIFCVLRIWTFFIWHDGTVWGRNQFLIWPCHLSKVLLTWKLVKSDQKMFNWCLWKRQKSLSCKLSLYEYLKSEMG